LNIQINGFQEHFFARIEKRPILWIGLFIIFVSAVIMLFWKNWGYDDPYITYRYAHNLASGVGFVYNPGERALSTTTPLFTLLLAGIGFFWSNIPLAANLLGTISIAVGAVFLFDIARSHNSPIVGLAALILYPTSHMILQTIGSETPLYLAFALAAFAFYFRKNYTITAIFSALVLLTRPDGALIPAILVVDFLLRKNKPIPWKAVAIFLILVAPWFVFSGFYFNSLIPSTLLTKHQQGILPVSIGFAAGILRTMKAQLAQWHNWPGLIVAIIGLIYATIFSRKWLVFLSWPLLYTLAYTLLRVATNFWYYAPLIPGYVTFIGLGLTAIYEGLHLLLDRPGQPEKAAIYLPAALIIILLAGLTASQAITSFYISERVDERYSIYRKVGKWLAKNTPENAAIGMLEVGIIGYYSQRTIIDFAGLIQPEVARQMLPTKNYNDAAIYAVELYEPQFLVLQDRQLPGLEVVVTPHPCIPKKHFSGAIFSSNFDMTVYACKYP